MSDIPKTIAELASRVEEQVPMHSAACVVRHLEHKSCEGCPHEDRCKYYALGYLVAASKFVGLLSEY